MPLHELQLLMPDSTEQWINEAANLWGKNSTEELPHESKKIIQRASNPSRLNDRS